MSVQQESLGTLQGRGGIVIPEYEIFDPNQVADDCRQTFHWLSKLISENVDVEPLVIEVADEVGDVRSHALPSTTDTLYVPGSATHEWLAITRSERGMLRVTEDFGNTEVAKPTKSISVNVLDKQNGKAQPLLVSEFTPIHRSGHINWVTRGNQSGECYVLAEDGWVHIRDLNLARYQYNVDMGVALSLHEELAMAAYKRHSETLRLAIQSLVTYITE